jgi:TRAP-type C4-dicarboxylate transport system substrate-binding protein
MKKIRLGIIGSMIVFFILGIAGVTGVYAASGIINLRMQSHTPPEQAHRTFDTFIKEVSEMTGGKINIKLYPVGTLVPTKELLEAVSNHVVEMATVAEGYWYNVVPVSIIGQGLPFAFNDNMESVYFMFHKGFLKLLREAYAKHNIYVIPYEPYNTGLMTKKPILQASDLNGLKLRGFGTMQKWLSKMGATTVSISGAELYTALATGVVEGAHWGDAFPMYEMKFQEVLKNYMLPEPIRGSWNSIWINMDVWNSFTKEQQALIESSALSAGGVLTYNDTGVRTKMALKDMQHTWGVHANVVPDAERAKMRKAAMQVWDEIAANKDPLCKEAINMLYDFLNEVGDLKK